MQIQFTNTNLLVVYKFNVITSIHVDVHVMLLFYTNDMHGRFNLLRYNLLRSLGIGIPSFMYVVCFSDLGVHDFQELELSIVS